MKIVVINGSHRGQNGNTGALVTAFLRGAQVAGANTENIVLAEKNIGHCKSCKSCWFNTPGKCVIKDDMADILCHITDADVRVLATPLYFDNLSSMMKVFIDRLIVLGSPYWTQDAAGECRHLTTQQQPKLMMIANCGYPERSQFQALSHWFHRHARNLGTEVIGEIYLSEGGLLTSQIPEIQPLVTTYLNAVEKAGKEIAKDMQFSPETSEILESVFIPADVYVRKTKEYVDAILKK